MRTRNPSFDHLIHWVKDLDAAMAAYDELGLPARAALTMPGFRNAAWGVDDERYVELAAVDDWEAVATSPYAEGVALLRPAVEAAGGEGPVTFAVDVRDAREVAARLEASGREVGIVEVRFEDKDAGFVEVFLRDAPPSFPFFISYDPPRAVIAQMRAEHREAQGLTLEGGPDLAALLVRSHDPEGGARILGELLSVPVDGATVALPGAEVRFEEGAPAGLFGIAVRGLDPSAGVRAVAGLEVVPEE
jgi:hypothetical protein